jgi:N-alpha-acetyltransferase 50
MAWLSQPVRIQAPTLAKPDAVRDNHDDPASPKSQLAGSLEYFKPGVVNPASESAPLMSNNGTQSLPSNVEIRACTKDDIETLKRLTGLLLPIQYPETFYREIIDDPITNNITLVAIWHNIPPNTSADQGILIGAIRCRLLAPPPSVDPAPMQKEGPMLYLSTLVLLSPYRSHGIATHMLNMLTKRAVREYSVTSVGAHVWEANLDGLEWYRKRGFLEVGREGGYYRRLNPSAAVVMQKKIGVMDLVGGRN